MAYLDVSPMIVALRASPAEFDISRGLLRHKPSGHRVVFDPLGGSARIEARCDCALLRVSHQQSRELTDAFHDWEESYWRVVRINREFASHFDRRFWPRLATHLERIFQSGLAALERLVPARRSRSGESTADRGPAAPPMPAE
ncbi:hypothetical protein KXR53_24725 [Inquilinus limosus]|uniref:hypothetical protein n=1 Tax=Inquilinus limosus TaxID=171674 RepID=UPI003F13641E